MKELYLVGGLIMAFLLGMVIVATTGNYAMNHQDKLKCECK